MIHALFSYDDGPQVHMHAGWSVAQIPFQAGYDAWFERGFIRYHGGDLQVFDNLNKVEKKDAEYERGDAYHNEIAYLANCIEMGTPPTECMPESARDSVALIGKEIAAAQSGQTINGKE